MAGKMMRDSKPRKIVESTTLMDSIIIGNEKEIEKHVMNTLRIMKPHMNELGAALATPGPENRPVFTKVHERKFIDASGIHFDDITKAIKNCDAISDTFTTQTNEFYIMVSCLISYHYKNKTIINKMEIAKILNMYLALRIYKAAFGAFFPNYLPNPDVMAATIERLNSNRYNLKKYKTIFNTIAYIADSHFENFEDILRNSIDDNVTYYITNLYSRIKQMMRLIANMYYENHEKGIRQGTDNMQSENDEGETYLNDVENVSSLVAINSRKIYMSFVSDTVANPKILRQVCKSTGVSFSKMTLTINTMMSSREPLVEDLVVKMLGLYYSKGGKTVKSTKFISEMYNVYSVSNSADKQILDIKEILHQVMVKYSKSYLLTTHAGQISNLKKTLWLYIVIYAVEVL